MNAANDVYNMGYAQLLAIARDMRHPQRAEAGEILDEWNAEDAARKTEAGGEA